jgi:hypothetical protein
VTVSWQFNMAHLQVSEEEENGPNMENICENKE